VLSGAVQVETETGGGVIRARPRVNPVRQLLSQPTGGVGVPLVVVIVLAAVLAPMLAPYDPARQSLLNTLLPPSSQHLLGTDEFGRDVLSRTIYGAQISLLVGVVAVGLSSLAGTILGQVAGYQGGRLDEMLMRLMDALFAFPALVLALVINTILGTSLTNAILAIAIVSIPGFARLARGSTLAVREREFVEAARTVGAPTHRILGRHILPNILPPLIVNASNLMSAAIITEGSLSFLGLGVQPPTPSWGSMLRAGYGYLDSSPWLALAPGLAMMITVLAFNLLGDAIRDALDPRLAERRAMG
jgi:peptide/nickel transport system permease protein